MLMVEDVYWHLKAAVVKEALKKYVPVTITSMPAQISYNRKQLAQP